MTEVTTQVFGSVYSDSYDTFYGEKDYQAECDQLEALFRQYAALPVHSLVDLGCGTGNHALPLSERGYHVIGIDRSEAMLAHARDKAQRLPVAQRPDFQLGDVRAFDLQQKFDAALMMFAVLGYQIDNADVLATLCAVRQHLEPGGLFIFDVWYGPAVLHQRPSDRLKVLHSGDQTLLRAAGGALDTYNHTCAVSYHVWQFSGDRVIGESEETHTMRYFFPQELKLFLEVAGFDLVQLVSFNDPQVSPSEKDWNILCIANATKLD